jgi:hypothetical protein
MSGPEIKLTDQYVDVTTDTIVRPTDCMAQQLYVNQALLAHSFVYWGGVGEGFFSNSQIHASDT